MKLVYIGGYGHSGSTLLAYLMASNSRVVVCGDVAGVKRAEAKRRKCSCGQLAQSCHVWGPVLDRGLVHPDLDLALMKHVSSDYDVLVDSSKTAWMEAVVPFKLIQKLGRDFKLIHITRDPRAVAWSIIKRSKRRGERRNKTLVCGEMAAGWLVANLGCELFRALYPDQYRRVRYEDLVDDPARITPPLLPETRGQWRFEAIGAGENRHQLFGNRMRRKPLSIRDIKNDDAWRREMPRTQRKIVAALTWPLIRIYDY
jgi:hypothetical protein